jgi:hypothetical protein
MQYYDQKKRDKQKFYTTLHRKLKFEQHVSHKTPGSKLMYSKRVSISCTHRIIPLVFSNFSYPILPQGFQIIPRLPDWRFHRSVRCNCLGFLPT